MTGVSTGALLHSTSLRGHRDCFEKYHLIANQKLSRAKDSHSAYRDIKRVLSQQISRIVQYAQNRDPDDKNHTQQGDPKLTSQSDSQVPRYAPHWVEEACGAGTEDLDLLQDSQQLWGNQLQHTQVGGMKRARRYTQHSQEECKYLTHFNISTSLWLLHLLFRCCIMCVLVFVWLFLPSLFSPNSA